MSGIRNKGESVAAYRFSAKMIKRSEGRSATAAAAYRAGVEIEDKRTGLIHDYTRRGGVVHSEIMLPDNAPEWMQDRADLWNAAEEAERRKDAQLAREFQMNLPHELDSEQRLALTRAFIRDECVSRGMVADIAIHSPDEKGDNRNHHAHVMLTLRVIDGDGFGKKERAWNDKALLEQWRERWAEYQNQELEKAEIDTSVDHRTLEAQGIDREPEPKLGAVATKMERDGKESHAGNDLRDVWKRNAERANYADQAERVALEIAQERAREAEQAQEERRQFQELYQLQRTTLEQERTQHQQQVDDLSARLEERSRLAVLWDKMRGRLGWRAEEELHTARMALEENQERARALELSEQMQQQREREEREQQAAEYEAVPPQPELSEYEPIQPLHMQQDIEPPEPFIEQGYDIASQQTTPDDIAITHAAPPEPSLEDYAEMFRQSREENTPADIEIQMDMDRE